MNVPMQAGAAQARAARPDRSSWVAANAGSGKTRVLTNRVARLLLRRTDPQKILCLTFTKAAAAEMQNRLFAQLGRWAMLPDRELRKELGALGADTGPVNDEDMREARRLFARALETPGGLKIQTIHAFCDRLLRRFPLEAGVSPDFAEMDQVRAVQLTAQVLDELALSPQTSRFDDIAEALAGGDLSGLVQHILLARARFRAPLDHSQLRTALNAPQDRTLQDILNGVMTTVTLPDLRAFCALLEAGKSSDLVALVKLRRALGETQPELALDRFESVFLFGKSTVPGRSNTSKAGAIPTKDLRLDNAALVARIEPMMNALENARQERLALEAFERAVLLHHFASAFLEVYDAKKNSLGLMDFDDLIERAGALLNDARVADWVLYRLDGGIDHVLVDEAQDTSPAQWEIIDAVTSDFFTGEGTRAFARTIFAVGDFKQSIYSFQGAEPALFSQKQSDFQHRITDAGDSLQDCDLLYSFRSATPILALVDRIFSGPQRGGVASDIRHLPAYADKAGRVDLWPFVEPPEKAEPTPWYLPVDMPALDNPQHVLGVAIAREISGWLCESRVLPGRGRAIRAGDILILVQSRASLFHSIIKELKEAGVAVAGADRLKIGEELVVRDMLSLLRFLSTPADDLSLAEVLRSPIFGITEAELYSLTQGRKATLWQALGEQSGRFPGVVHSLDDLLRYADYERPYEMMERVLVQHGARGRILARLGHETADALDELLSQALAYERTEAPTLTGFLERMQNQEIEIIRQTDDRSDRVRVMTVHGAKGLESPIVFLPDTLARQQHGTGPIVKMPDGQVAWPKSGAVPDAVRAAKDRQAHLADEERMRLLYVALTRAENWLIVCGAGDEKRRENSWYELVERALTDMGAVEVSGAGGLAGPVRRLDHEWRDKVDEGGAVSGLKAATVLPDWATMKAKAPRKLAGKTLQPSDLGGEHSLPAEIDADGEAAALRRGLLLHWLLEGLPAVPQASWRDAARRILLNAGALEDRDALDALASEAIAVLTTPEFAHIFASGALAEVPVSARLESLDGRPLSGRIDRLIVNDREILAIDFKSNRIVPATPEEIPEGLLRQMGAYRAALGAIWPGRVVETAILWTRTPELMRIPDEITSAAISRAGAP